MLVGTIWRAKKLWHNDYEADGGKAVRCVLPVFSNGYKDYWDEYGFTVKNGSKTLLTAYDESEWKTFSTVLKRAMN